MKTKIIIVGMLSLAIVGCSSGTKSVVQVDRIGEEEVLQTYGKHDDLKEAPQFVVDGRTVRAIAMSTINGDSGRPESAIKIAQASARSLVAKTVENKLESHFSAGMEGTSLDATEVRELITESVKMVATDWRIGPTYYERVKIYGDSGVPRTEIRAWAQIELEEQVFKKHVIDSLRRQEGRMGVSAEFHKSVSDHWQKLISGDTPKNAEAQSKPVGERKPASVEESNKDAE